ncbi:hypothetical protein [Amycolatopsis sp. EV170708-02-1]|nr:hypothetical protein [Amycolatopsis sp. EV170708-02-1]UMP06094.1 hypothetical protein MJQ72_15315 [Amycolatopsis sp. EV170708-02-1]
MTSPALSPLAGALARTDFAENRYRWCSRGRRQGLARLGRQETSCAA